MFNIPPTQIRSYGDGGHGLVSHPTDWRDMVQTLDPWVQGEWFIHYTTVGPTGMVLNHLFESEMTP